MDYSINRDANKKNTRLKLNHFTALSTSSGNRSPKLTTRSNAYSNMIKNISSNTMEKFQQEVDSRDKKIKLQLLEDFNKNIQALSPKNNLLLKENIRCYEMRKKKNIAIIPKIFERRDKKAYTYTCAPVTKSKKKRPKTITQGMIRDELKWISKFFKSTLYSVDEKIMYKNLSKPKISSYMSRMKEFNQRMYHTDLKRKVKEIQSMQVDENSERWKSFVGNMNNPSFGLEGLQRAYPEYYKHFKNKIERNNSRFQMNYDKKYYGSVLVAKRIGKDENEYKKYENTKNTKFTQVSKLKMKWKTIKWLMDNKKDVLDRLMEFQEKILKLSDKKSREFDRGLNIQEFTTVMKNNGITNDPDLIRKLFWVFDEDGDNDLKYKEIAFGIEMFRDTSVEDKLKGFFKLCDTDNSGTISKQEFINLLKKNIIDNDEKLTIKQIVDKIFKDVTTDENGELTLTQLREGFRKNRELADIIDKNLIALKSIDNVIDNDIKKDLMSFNPEQNNQLRMKLLDLRVVFYPSRDEQFCSLMNDFVSNKEKLLEYNKKMEEKKEDFESYDEEEEEDVLFKEDREFLEKLEMMKKKRGKFASNY